MGKPKVTKKAAAKATKKIVKKAGPRQTRTIQAAVAEAKVNQPSAGARKLPRQNRRNKQARNKTAKGKKGAAKK